MNNKQKNNICKCGHLESQHCHMRGCSCSTKFCDLSLEGTDTEKMGFKHCAGYVQDNLNYLEYLYESRHK